MWAICKTIIYDTDGCMMHRRATSITAYFPEGLTPGVVSSVLSAPFNPEMG
jgi:hypothetical protein